MPIKTLTHNNLTWTVIDQVDAEAKTYLRDEHRFHLLDLEDVETPQQIPKMDVYKEYIFLVLQIPQWDEETQTVVAQEIDLFVGENYLISIQSTRSKELKNFFYRCLGNKTIQEECMNNSSGYLLYRLLEALFHTTRPVLNHFGKDISSLEQKIFSGNQQSSAILE